MNTEKHPSQPLLVGLEIGTATIKAVVGEKLSTGTIRILGVSSTPSKGIEKGGVSDLTAVMSCVETAISEVSRISGCEIVSLSLALSGKHIGCRNEIGLVPLGDTEVTQEDVDHVIHIGQSVKIHDQHRLLHVIPQEFTIDYQEHIKNPIGLSGMRMEANVHLITCHNDTAKNLLKAVEQCGLTVKHSIFSGLASSEAVLSADEKELGVCLVDIGAGTMDICIYTEGALRHSAVIPYAGNVVTRDIAYAFGTPLQAAETAKILHGCALQKDIPETSSVEIPRVGGRDARIVPKKMLAKIIEPRYVELLTLVYEEVTRIQSQLQQKGLKYHLAAGIVLTGGGALLDGVLECAQAIFQLQVRLGIPYGLAGMTEQANGPDFSTPLGLLHYSSQALSSERNAINQKGLLLSKICQFKDWLKKEF